MDTLSHPPADTLPLSTPPANNPQEAHPHADGQSMQASRNGAGEGTAACRVSGAASGRVASNASGDTCARGTDSAVSIEIEAHTGMEKDATGGQEEEMVRAKKPSGRHAGKLVLFGYDMSPYSACRQFLVAVPGIFFFFLLYGIVQASTLHALALVTSFAYSPPALMHPQLLPILPANMNTRWLNNNCREIRDQL